VLEAIPVVALGVAAAAVVVQAMVEAQVLLLYVAMYIVMLVLARLLAVAADLQTIPLVALIAVRKMVEEVESELFGLVLQALHVNFHQQIQVTCDELCYTC
jgi:hypothetical protein